MFHSKRQRKTSLNNQQIQKRKKSAKKSIEFGFIGTSRSGMNAVARWVLTHFRGFAFYKANPLSSLPTQEQKDRIQSKENLVVRNKGNIVCLAYRFRNLTPKECLTDSTNVLVLRNPYHQLASLVQWKKIQTKGNFNVNEYILFRSLWIEYAKVFLNSKLFDGKNYYILFDRWATDQDYRQKILTTLGKNFSSEDTDITKLVTPSAFQDTKVCKRFEEMKNELPLKAIVRDSKIQSLWKKIAL
jgi:hypothetical protein